MGTLIHPEPDVVTLYHRVGERYGSKLDHATVGTKFRAAYRSATTGRGSTKTDESAEFRFWQRIVTEVFDDLDDPQECFDELFAHFAKPEAWRLAVGAEEVVQELRERDIRVAVGSNFDARLHAILDGHSLGDLISHRFISSEMGVRKPDPEFYQQVIDAIGCPADQVLFVGDDQECDFEGPQRVGARAMLLGTTIPHLGELLTHLDRGSNSGSSPLQ
ncbi:Alpha-D-glucose-1-phosphate phosphatase YihX [Calycomorphotria hydatis]|uniref:Alpha-D-glucose-1-phosphate phosphatase YihX n=1 Tax=Calycomorphotria hydatis TaxID=2528027 RepID=A0A517T3K9_9PLAN|nr:Alpha-D-glucose-1-phosphate phosphatase YihX [Calycomorphotria hydatis]